MDNFDYEKLKKEKENNYLRLVIIGALLVAFFMGGVDMKSGVAPEGKAPIVSLDMPNKNNLTTSFKEDIINYIPNAKKTSFIKTHKTTRGMAEDISKAKERVDELKQEEDQLNTLISNVPIEIYNHSKLDLTAFMVEELKQRNLVYAIKYNYDLNATDEEEESSDNAEEVEEDEDGEEEIVNKKQSPKITPITDAFSVIIYQIDKDDNYRKVLDALDIIYIKEPYEIIKFQMGYDVISKSYYAEYAIGI